MKDDNNVRAPQLEMVQLTSRKERLLFSSNSPDTIIKRKTNQPMISVDQIVQNMSETMHQEAYDLEGECRIDKYQSLRRNWFKTLLLMPIAVVLSAFILLALMRKRKKISALLMYSECSMAEATHILIVGNDKSTEIVDYEGSSFSYRKVKYLARNNKKPYPLGYDLEDSPYFSSVREYIETGLSQDTAIFNQKIYGRCEHIVEIPGLLSYVAEEMVGIFYILMYITVVIYVLEGFIFFGVVMVGASLATTIINFFLLRSSYLRIKELAEHYTIVKVVRSGKIVEIASTELVPGDIFRPQGEIPCDCLLVQGQVYVNEASLTGESVPISKSPALNKQNAKLQSSWLFEGSSVLEHRGYPLALVVHTGYVTRKGKIFRKILFRQHIQPEFYWYAFYFMLEMLVYCIIIFCGMIPLYLSKAISTKLMILRFFDMVGWAIPPSFPIVFNVCYSLSLWRLKKQGIFGTEPYKTIVSGKVTVACFDKTGTLTQNAMQLNSIIKFPDGNATTINAKVESLPISDIMMKLMACCHTVRRVNGQFLGDELDLRMFGYSGYGYEVPQNDTNVKLILQNKDQKLHILRINQFESKFQAMSVLAYDTFSNKYYVFVKGAPQKIQKASLNTVNNYYRILSDVSLAGLRCLAVAYRQVSNPQQFLKMRRQEFQEHLTLFGLVTFDNKLKDDTAETIHKLSQADIQVKVITGDNIYIGVQTAIRAKILRPEESVLVLQGDLQPLYTKEEDLFSKQINFNCELLTREDGAIQSQMMKMTLEQLTNESLYACAIDNSFLNKFEFIPKNTKIFARITPESKAQVVKMIKNKIKAAWKSKSRWERIFGRTLNKVAMVGDGANDIMAIKEADLGIGISDSDSSFAANFTVSNMLQIEYIFREGKATLSLIVDSMRYYGGVSVLKFISNSVLIWDRSSFNDNQFTYLNYFSTIEIMFFLFFSKPTQHLSRFLPNDNLMSMQSRLVYIGNIVIPSICFIICQFVLVISPFHTWTPNSGIAIEQWPFRCQSNTAVFLPSHLYYIWNVFFIYTSEPWKQPIWNNLWLMLWITPVIIVNSVLFFITPYLTPFLDITELPINLMATIFGITHGFMLLSLIWKVFIDRMKLYRVS